MEVLNLRTKLKITFWKIKFKKLVRPEFWPAWFFYAPIVPYIVYLTVRYRGFGTICAANPGIPLGGLVGESKEQILRSISSEHILRFLKVSRTESDPTKEFEFVNRETLKRKFKFPYILKPDAGQRGSGVRLVKSENEIFEYLKKTNVDLIVQEYHPGPQEAGIFYYRFPKEDKGKILSITRKTFPILEGNGIDSLGKLILGHPRFRYQWKVFRERYVREWETVLPKGEKKRLAEAGNHCQGVLFTDGSRLITEELTRKIDQISKTFPGFYFGRYDIRYRSDEELKMGKEFGIVELNGVTSESTNLYDPDFSLWEMYTILFKQWNLLFRIGSENRKRGVPKTSLREIIKTVIRFYGGNRRIDDRSD
ncbi:carboxylate--amine ligase [Leptospira santarosai]|uniref:Carboxylate--amine ligase n=2 Tax=Leptospira santarosai TaxID=28183 RepID=A0AB73M394_9LEPT|nr:carboxylate--amine ligase [Leptospira santarosai]EKS09425.1 ATP-grasp domain protein [Leptospira santarosai str. JET]EKT85250.1 carboxylate-amine ligase [Leptospira santarosai serovar Shermani str. LT 821]EMM75998.1 ATP-grasp domain protein [Leptospira santarosai str. 2000030832]EMO12551.1 ATP-grasp domain protein [Leptospira santarosai str. CBC523]EMP02191.1 ATP-grasp domain protein [Leptospira santarosai str. HAI1380]